MLKSLSDAGADYEVHSDSMPNRRFSGDGTLSRTRYFSLCTRDGGDSGTMRRELTAYHDPLTVGVVDISDPTESEGGTKDQFSKPPSSAPSSGGELVISIPPFTAIQHEALREALTHWEAVTAAVPVRVVTESFERLIDLRVPHVAAWFTQELTRLCWLNDDNGETRAFPNKEPLDRFFDLLPSLAVQTLGGGNGATRIAGQWLRSIGADGLVFPSARSDSVVEVRDGELGASYGWNMVDYRSADPVRLRSLDLTSSWIQRISNESDELPLRVYANVALHSSERGPDRGSWSWTNLEEANVAARLLASALHLYRWAIGNQSSDREQLLAFMLGATDDADVLASMSGWFVRAMVGEKGVRKAFIESVAEGLDLADARLVDLPGTFESMDAKVRTSRMSLAGSGG